MDDAVNRHLHDHGVGLQVKRFVAESSCRYLRPLSYPGAVAVGLSVSQLGRSSVTYSIGIFGNRTTGGDQYLAARGTFAHVYVDGDGRPKPISRETRAVIEPLFISGDKARVSTWPG